MVTMFGVIKDGDNPPVIFNDFPIEKPPFVGDFPLPGRWDDNGLYWVSWIHSGMPTIHFYRPKPTISGDMGNGWGWFMIGFSTLSFPLLKVVRAD